VKSFSEFWVGVESEPVVVEVSSTPFTNIRGKSDPQSFPLPQCQERITNAKLNSIANITSLYNKTIIMLGRMVM
jgi:hypothetical protein